jgi:DNA polymerase III epsilon subunit-like protein
MTTTNYGYKPWQLTAIDMMRNTTESRRTIAKTVGKARSTVLDFLRKYSQFTEVAVEPTPGRVPEGAKILLLDIECAPTCAYVWGRWDNNVSQKQVVHEGYLLTYSAKWLGASTIVSNRIVEAGDDEQLVRELAELMNQADLVVAHNAQKFDIPLIKTRMVALGMTPPSPSKIVDTLRIAKAEFRFPSNSLDSIAAYLGLPRKMSHSGFELWTRCMAMEEEAFNEMLEYNVQDVVVLEEVYMRLRHWSKTHPNVALYTPAGKPRCVCCGSEDLTTIEKKYFTGTSEYNVLKCNSCGKMNRTRKNVSEHSKHNSLTNVGK